MHCTAFRCCCISFTLGNMRWNKVETRPCRFSQCPLMWLVLILVGDAQVSLHVLVRSQVTSSLGPPPRLSWFGHPFSGPCKRLVGSKGRIVCRVRPCLAPLSLSVLFLPCRSQLLPLYYTKWTVHGAGSQESGGSAVQHIWKRLRWKRLLWYAPWPHSKQVAD